MAGGQRAFCLSRSDVDTGAVCHPEPRHALLGHLVGHLPGLGGRRQRNPLQQPHHEAPTGTHACRHALLPRLQGQCTNSLEYYLGSLELLQFCYSQVYSYITRGLKKF